MFERLTVIDSPFELRTTMESFVSVVMRPSIIDPSVLKTNSAPADVVMNTAKISAGIMRRIYCFIISSSGFFLFIRFIVSPVKYIKEPKRAYLSIKINIFV